MIDKAHLRKSSEAQRLALKSSTDRALDVAGGPANMQYETRVVVGNLSKYGSPNDPMFAPVDVALDIDLKAREPIITRALALAQGFDLIALAANPDARPWSAEMGSLADEMGKLLASLGDAAAETAVTPPEANACLEQAEQLRTQLEELVARLALIGQGAKDGG